MSDVWKKEVEKLAENISDIHASYVLSTLKRVRDNMECEKDKKVLDEFIKEWSEV